MNDETITHPRQPNSFQMKCAGVPTEHTQVLSTGHIQYCAFQRAVNY